MVSSLLIYILRDQSPFHHFFKRGKSVVSSPVFHFPAPSVLGKETSITSFLFWFGWKVMKSRNLFFLFSEANNFPLLNSIVVALFDGFLRDDPNFLHDN